MSRDANGGRNLCIAFAIFACTLLAGVIVPASAQDQIILTGVVRDFQELQEDSAGGGHPDFNPNRDTVTKNENWGCFDRPDAAKGAIQDAIGTTDPNPDHLPGMVPFDRDGFTPLLKAGYDTASGIPREPRTSIAPFSSI